MKKLAFISCLLILAVSGLNAQSNLGYKKVETVEKKGKDLVIPYVKYAFDNGLTLIVHEDHSDPICHVDVTYHVGSAREQLGRSGFAHFFEHMMFQGSDHVGDNEHFKIVSESGGSLNGNTTKDRTRYFETLPSNQLETALWLESDRMGFLLDAVTQEKFENQRSTVKNERGQNYDNKPYGVVWEKIGAAEYPVGHPYSWSTIGYLEDLNRVNVDDLKKFFLRWYGPNNAVVTVAGDVNPEKVAELVNKYFGAIPKGPAVQAAEKIAAVLNEDRFLSYEDQVKMPLFVKVFPTVASHHVDEAPLDILASYLSDGKSSLFYQNFIKSKIAIQAEVSHPTEELAGNFTVRIMPYNPGKSIAQIDSLIGVTFANFEKSGIPEAALKRFKASHEAAIINSLTSVSGKANQLSDYQTYSGNANGIGNDLDRYNKVTAEDVMRVYNKYIKGHHSVNLSVYPKGKPDLVARADNFQIPQRDLSKVKEGDEYKNLSYVKAKDNFDRKQRPASGPAPVANVPDYWKYQFNNGLMAIGAENNEVPTVSLQLSIEAGHRYEPLDKAGLAYLTARLMNEGTLKHSAEQISDLLEGLGSSIQVNSSENAITIFVNALSKNLKPTLDLVQEILLQPKFDQETFDRLKNEQLQLISNQATQATVIANNVYAKLNYGGRSIMGLPWTGTSTSVGNIQLADVKAYYSNFSTENAQLVAVGDVRKKKLLKDVAFLDSWKRKPAIALDENATGKNSVQPATTKIYFVNKEKAPQSEIRIGFLSMPYDATGEFFRSTVMNFALGGTFNSRINLNLRETKGWTYGARSGFSGSKFVGPFTASAGVRANVTDSAIIEFMKEIKNYADNGTTATELKFTQLSMSLGEALRYETPNQKAAFLKRLLDYDLDKNYTKTQNGILNGITKAEIDALAKKHLTYNNFNIVVVGDKAKVFKGISQLGYEVIELDAEGNKVQAELPPIPVQSH